MSARLQNVPILAVVSDLDDIDISVLFSAAKIFLSKEILGSGIRLLGIIKILRADPQNRHPYRWIWTEVHLYKLQVKHAKKYICNCTWM